MRKENNTDETSNTLTIPTREEFHRYASNVLNENDFCTDYPGASGYQVNRVAQSLRWSVANRNYDQYYIRRIS